MATFHIEAVNPLTKTKSKYTLNGEAKFVKVDEREEDLQVFDSFDAVKFHNPKVDITLEDVTFSMEEEHEATTYRIFWRDNAEPEIVLAHSWRFAFNKVDDKVIEFLDQYGDVEDVFMADTIRGVVKVIDNG